MDEIHAPQGRVPMSIPSLVPPSISRGSSRPDFVRGFGVDIPEEEEPQEEEPHPDTDVEEKSPDNEDGLGLVRAPSRPTTEPDGMTPLAHSRFHSRHVSRLSHALSLHSVGGIHDVGMSEQVDMVPIRSPVGNPNIDDLDKEAVGEWTGSEDVRLDSDDEVKLFHSQSVCVFIFPRRASVNGPTLRTRSGPVRTGCNVVYFVKGSKSWKLRDACPISLLRHLISLACGFAVTTIWSRIQAKMGCMRSREQRSSAWILWTLPSAHHRRRPQDVDLSLLYRTLGMLPHASSRMPWKEHTLVLTPVTLPSSSALHLLPHLPCSIHMQSRSCSVPTVDQVHGDLWMRLLRHQHQRWVTLACPHLGNRSTRPQWSSSQPDLPSALPPVYRNSLSLYHLLRVPSLHRLRSLRRHAHSKAEKRDNDGVQTQLHQTMEAMTAARKIWRHSDSRPWTRRLVASATLHPVRHAYQDLRIYTRAVAHCSPSLSPASQATRCVASRNRQKWNLRRKTHPIAIPRKKRTMNHTFRRSR